MLFTDILRNGQRNALRTALKAMQHHLLVLYQGNCHKFHHMLSRRFGWRSSRQNPYLLILLGDEAQRVMCEVWCIHVETVHSQDKSLFFCIGRFSHAIAKSPFVLKNKIPCSAENLSRNTAMFIPSCDWGYDLHQQTMQFTNVHPVAATGAAIEDTCFGLVYLGSNQANDRATRYFSTVPISFGPQNRPETRPACDSRAQTRGTIALGAGIACS